MDGVGRINGWLETGMDRGLEVVETRRRMVGQTADVCMRLCWFILSSRQGLGACQSP